MAHCNKCNYENIPTHNFCIKCGNKLTIETRKNHINNSIIKKFKKSNLIYIIFSIILLLTNPNEEKHEFAVNLKASDVLREKYDNGSIFSQLGIIIGEGIASEYIKNKVSRQNLLLFSITRINGSICGIGFLDNVYLSPEVKRIINSSISDTREKIIW